MSFSYRSEQARKLNNQGFSRGLRQSLSEHAHLFAQRIWILDNSGSMAIGDGHRIVEIAGGKIESQIVTRWEELQQSSLFHAELAANLGLRTQFRLLNYPGDNIGVQEFTVAEYPDDENHLSQELRLARNILQRTKPAGVTPLTSHLVNVEKNIRLVREELIAAGKQVSLVICTDGLPTDAAGDESVCVHQDFINVLKSMKDLPVCIVIRLCGRDKVVSDFYNQLDTKLGISLDVLEDHACEARQVMRFNKWLNYTLSLHRCRELGYQSKLLDVIDERPLTVHEIWEFCSILLGSEVVHSWPNPITQTNEFCDHLQRHLQSQEKEQWDPIKHRMAPLINSKILLHTLGKKRWLFRFGY